MSTFCRSASTKLEKKLYTKHQATMLSSRWLSVEGLTVAELKKWSMEDGAGRTLDSWERRRSWPDQCCFMLTGRRCFRQIIGHAASCQCPPASKTPTPIPFTGRRHCRNIGGQRQRIRGFLKCYALYKSTFYLLYLLTYLPTLGSVSRDRSRFSALQPTQPNFAGEGVSLAHVAELHEVDYFSIFIVQSSVWC